MYGLGFYGRGFYSRNIEVQEAKDKVVAYGLGFYGQGFYGSVTKEEEQEVKEYSLVVPIEFSALISANAVVCRHLEVPISSSILATPYCVFVELLEDYASSNVSVVALPVLRELAEEVAILSFRAGVILGRELALETQLVSSSLASSQRGILEDLETGAMLSPMAVPFSRVLELELSAVEDMMLSVFARGFPEASIDVFALLKVVDVLEGRMVRR